MAAETRIYIVDNKHLVKASNGAQALRHVVKNKHTVAVATQEECIKLATEGIKVEDAGNAGV